VTTQREERIVLNEAMFRTANERAAAWEEREGQSDEVELFYCECASLECREKVALSGAEYEGVRKDPTHFLVARGHDVPDVETVIEEHEEWVVVQKDPEVQGLAEATDHRSP
jgi:hypothetical protein